MVRPFDGSQSRASNLGHVENRVILAHFCSCSTTRLATAVLGCPVMTHSSVILIRARLDARSYATGILSDHAQQTYTV